MSSPRKFGTGVAVQFFVSAALIQDRGFSGRLIDVLSLCTWCTLDLAARLLKSGRGVLKSKDGGGGISRSEEPITRCVYAQAA